MLPDNHVVWPPEDMTGILATISEWDARYAGDHARLGTIHAEKGLQYVDGNQFTARTGLTRNLTRWLWGNRQGGSTSTPPEYRVPAASDLAQLSSDLLFSEPIDAAVAGEDVHDQDSAALAGVLEERLHGTLAGAAETCAAHGGVYLQATWDTVVVPGRVFITRVDSDFAVPRFRRGRLVGVTFWREVGRNGNQVFRHLEDHCLSPLGIGVIQHCIYQGSDDKLGMAVPLTEHPATALFAGQVDQDGNISTETPGLDVVYVPNLTPSRIWRRHPVGAHLGRADIDGVEDLLDALDVVYTAMMRDVRLGQARAIIPESFLDDQGLGNGMGFDADREIFSPVHAPPGSAADAKMSMEFVQPQIRVAEHVAIAAELLTVIARSAGYSMATLGEAGPGTAVTATEVTARERRTYTTRDRKIREWKPALETILAKAVAMQAVLFDRRTPTTGLGVTVQFGDAIQETAKSLAETASLLLTAGAASVETRVRIVHPDWGDEQVADEVERILTESGLRDAARAAGAEDTEATDLGTGPEQA